MKAILIRMYDIYRNPSNYSYYMNNQFNQGESVIFGIRAFESIRKSEEFTDMDINNIIFTVLLKHQDAKYYIDDHVIYKWDKDNIEYINDSIVFNLPGTITRSLKGEYIIEYNLQINGSMLIENGTIPIVINKVESSYTDDKITGYYK